MKNSMPWSTPKPKGSRELKVSAFVREYLLNGFDASNAYRKAFSISKESGKYKYSHVKAHDFLIQKDVQDEIKRRQQPLERRANRLGLTEGFILKKIKFLCEAKNTIKTKDGEVIGEQDNFGAIAKGVELYGKFLGKFAAEKSELTGPHGAPLFPDKPVEKLTVDELKARKETILKQLREG